MRLLLYVYSFEVRQEEKGTKAGTARGRRLEGKVFVPVEYRNQIWLKLLLHVKSEEIGRGKS